VTNRKNEKRSVNGLLVEMEADWKAEHAVEPSNEMHSPEACATTREAAKSARVALPMAD
jgi:hypothetical protein